MIFKFRRPHPITPSPLWRDFQKKVKWKLVDFTKKSQFYTVYIIFQTHTEVIMIGLSNFCHVLNQIMETASFSWVMRKIVWKKWRKLYKFGTNDRFFFKLIHQFKTVTHIVLKLQIYIFWSHWVINRQRALQPGRAGTDRACLSWISFIMSEIKQFCSLSSTEKINSVREIALFLFPIWLCYLWNTLWSGARGKRWNVYNWVICHTNIRFHATIPYQYFTRYVLEDFIM